MMPVLAAALIDAAIVLALGLTAAVVLRRRSASLRHAMLATSVLMAAMMPVFELLVPQVPVIRWSTTAQVVSSGLMFSSGDVIHGSESVDAASAALQGMPSWTMVAGIWMLGVIVTGAGLLTGFRALYRLERRCRPIAGRWRELTDALAQECGVKQRVRLLESDDPSLLISCGVLAPTIILPSGTAAWSDERKRVVLRHELAHIKRRDAAIQIGSELLRVVQWVNPFVWLACRRLRQESEYACDDEVLSAGVEPSDYATHLLDVAKYLTGRSAALASAHSIANPSTLERRIVAMLHERNRAPVSGLGWAVAALLALSVSVPLAAAAFAVETQNPGGAPVATPATKAVTSAHAPTATPVPAAAARTTRAATTQQTSTIAGAVLDPTGGSIPGAEVTLTDTQAGTALAARTNASGGFRFPDLSASRYELIVRQPGFAAVSNVLTVAGGTTVRRTITLPLGSVQETIHVVCGAPSAVARVIAGIYPVLYAQDPPPAPTRVGGQIRPPTKTKDVKPTCPATVLAPETTVRLTGRIGVDGLMNDVKLTPSDTGFQPQSELVDAAQDAVRQWRFTPTQLNNQPVDTAITINVVFRKP